MLLCVGNMLATVATLILITTMTGLILTGPGSMCMCGIPWVSGVPLFLFFRVVNFNDFHGYPWVPEGPGEVPPGAETQAPPGTRGAPPETQRAPPGTQGGTPWDTGGPGTRGAPVLTRYHHKRVTTPVLTQYHH